MEHSDVVASTRRDPRNARSLAIAFFIVLGAGLAFLVGQRIGTSLDHHGRSVTVAHDHTSPPPSIAQK